MSHPSGSTSAVPLRLNRDSLYVLAFYIVVIAITCLFTWEIARSQMPYILPREHFLERFDWLLLGMFITFVGTSLLGTEVKSDAFTLIAGSFGGLLIESWGTNTGLWGYFTGEKPPWWIVAPWGASAVCIDRLQRALVRLPPFERASDRAITVAYWVSMAAYSVVLLRFVGPALFAWPTLAILALTYYVVLRLRAPRTTLSLIAAGTLLGYGVASVGFWRLSQFLRVTCAPKAASAIFRERA
jgi:hypothetical protein